MDELLAEAETNVKRTRAAKNAPDSGPVVEKRRGTFWGSVLAVGILLLLAATLGATAETVARFTGPDYNDARRHGAATVEQCTRRGPITLKGFGYFDQCTVKIVWDGGLTSRVVISKPGFMQGEKPGATFKIGENQGSRGTIGYSRPELPSRGWIGWLAAFIAFLAVLPVLAVVVYLRGVMKDSIGRR